MADSKDRLEDFWLEHERDDPEAIRDIMETFGCTEEEARKLWEKFMNRTLHRMKDISDR